MHYPLCRTFSFCRVANELFTDMGLCYFDSLQGLIRLKPSSIGTEKTYIWMRVMDHSLLDRWSIWEELALHDLTVKTLVQTESVHISFQVLPNEHWLEDIHGFTKKIKLVLLIIILVWHTCNFSQKDWKFPIMTSALKEKCRVKKAFPATLNSIAIMSFLIRGKWHCYAKIAMWNLSTRPWLKRHTFPQSWAICLPHLICLAEEKLGLTSARRYCSRMVRWLTICFPEPD